MLHLTSCGLIKFGNTIQPSTYYDAYKAGCGLIKFGNTIQLSHISL